MQKAEPPAEAWPVVPSSESAKSNGHTSHDGQEKDPAKRPSKLWHELLRLPTQVLDGTQYWVQSTQADFFFGGWIVVNALILAIETDGRTAENEDHLVWVLLDSSFNVVFLIEMMLRIRAEKGNWYRDVWNMFDAVLVFVGVLDSWILPATGLKSDMRFVTLMRLFRLLRLIRVLRVLRLLRFLKELMLLVQGITSAMRAMVWGLLLLGITIFICALLITRLVGKACCDSDDTFQDPLFHELFGTFTRTSFTLFQFTMEFQPDICRDTWEYGPWLTIFFLAYTMFTNITLLNTVASVIVENILSIAQQHQEEDKARREAEMAKIAQEQVGRLFELADTDGDRMITRLEISAANPAVEELLELSGVTLDQALNLFSVMDVDSNGFVSREEFQIALFRGDHALEAKDVLRIQCQVDTVKTKMTNKFEDAKKQNKTILEVLCRIEARQACMEARQIAMEDKLASVRQPEATSLDSMSIRFVPKHSRPTPGTNNSAAVIPPETWIAAIPKPPEPPAPVVLDTDFREETLLV